MRKIAVLLVLLALVGPACRPTGHVEHPKPPLALGLLSPIIVQDTKTTFDLSAYLTEPEKVTEISADGYKVVVAPDRKTVSLEADGEIPPLSFLQLSLEGRVYGIPIKREVAASVPDTPDEKELGAFRIATWKAAEGAIVLKATHAPTQCLAFWENNPIPCKRGDAGSLTVRIPDEAASHDRSHVRAFAYHEDQISNDIVVPLRHGQVVTRTEDLTRMDKHNLIIYALMIDRFVDGDPSNTRKVNDKRVLPKANYFGGDLEGVLQTLDKGYFETLGVNTLWISPIVRNPEGAYQEWPQPRRWYSGYHGYWPVASKEIDPRLGTNESLHALVTSAHGRSINILLDFVSNHVHEEHPLYKQHPEYFNGVRLPDGSMNIRKWDEEHRITTWFDTFLPDLNYENPKVVDAMADVAVWWVKEFGVDGFRHDAVKHIPDHFWSTLGERLRSEIEVPENRRLYQIGETFDDKRALIRSYMGSGKLDAQFDFNVYFALTGALLGTETFDTLAEAIRESFEGLRIASLDGQFFWVARHRSVHQLCEWRAVAR